MPYRCTNCQHISKLDDNPECKTRKICNFQKVEVIHFEHPEGTGRVNSQGHKVVMEDKKEHSVKAEMKLFCNSTVKFAHVTPAFFAVTCVDCINNFKTAKPELFRTGEEPEETPVPHIDPPTIDPPAAEPAVEQTPTP